MTKSNSDEDRYCERMDFPNTFNEFAEQYGFTDKEEHYTNGSQLIPVFRVKQWLDHLPSIQPKPKTECSCEQIKWERDIAIEQLHELGYELGQKIEPCEDCISRAEAINAISHAELSFQVESDLNFENYKREVQEIADGILKGQVKAISDLPSIQPKTDVLDKIRAEIEQVKYIMNEEIINHDRKDLINFVNGLNQSLAIIDTYKAEKE